MDYQKPEPPKTVHVRYSSDFRQAGGKTYLAANDIAHEKSNSSNLPIAGGVFIKHLPKGWRYVEPEFNHRGTARQYNPPNDSSCSICMQYEGLKEKYIAPMKRLTREPAHKLSEKELDELDKLIPDYKDKTEFLLSSASTQEIGGKRVLIVEGKSVPLNRDFYWIYSYDPRTENYTRVWYSGTPEASARYKKEAIESIHGLEFR